MAEQIAEYESQLAEVETLLQASPEDASLLSLKSDLLELLSITKQSSSGSGAAASLPDKDESKPLTTSNDVFDKALQTAAAAAVAEPADSTTFADTVQEAAANAAAAASAGIPTTIDTGGTAKEAPPKKKSKKIKQDFEVPQHLIPLDTDSAAERNKKRRALKALKGKWRESKKEAESAQKQKSWQSFQKKKKLNTTSSMFSTTTTGDAAVGVVVAAKRRQKDA